MCYSCVHSAWMIMCFPGRQDFAVQWGRIAVPKDLPSKHLPIQYSQKRGHSLQISNFVSAEAQLGMRHGSHCLSQWLSGTLHFLSFPQSFLPGHKGKPCVFPLALGSGARVLGKRAAPAVSQAGFSYPPCYELESLWHVVPLVYFPALTSSSYLAHAQPWVCRNPTLSQQWKGTLSTEKTWWVD